MGRSKMLLGLTGATALVALLGGACGAAAQPTATPEAMMKKETPGAMMTKETPDAMMKKETPAAMMKKDLPPNLIAPHFVDSAPGHGQAFKQAPPAVVINFNFNLHEKSSLTVTRDGAAVAIGAVAIDPNKLTMRASLPAGSGDGLYVVGYKACWPDGSCHDGQFGFVVDSKSAYLDMTGKAEVAIALEGFKFNPGRVIVSKGTKVTWTNRDSVTHFVNTDPHPSHNALQALNSRDLNAGQSFSFVFDAPGEWAYHCSAHYPSMIASIVVQ